MQSKPAARAAARLAVRAVAVSAFIAGPAPASEPAAGDAARGKAHYAQLCTICHHPSKNGIGPHHGKLFGRKAGSVADYAYSPGFSRLDLTWNARTLDSWLAAPELLVPGQKMGFYVQEAQIRADLIAYLRTTPQP